jgi:hypothetical protein
VKVVALNGVMPPTVATGLAALEQAFTYPLGASQRFHVSHGDDYTAFVRSMGESVTLVVEADGRAIGALSMALRSLTIPGGEISPSIYICDLKVLPDQRHGFVLRRLFRAALRWGEARASSAFGVVMRGTGTTPEEYSGRIGTPLFRHVGSISVLRLSCDSSTQTAAEVDVVPVEEITKIFPSLSSESITARCGDSTGRSLTPARGLRLRDGSACGILEDTRGAKRLLLDDGSEIVSAHLSCFAASSTDAAARLLGDARTRAYQDGFPALFVAADVSSALGESRRQRLLSTRREPPSGILS